MQRVLLSLLVGFCLLTACHREVSKVKPVTPPAPQPDPWASHRPLLQGDTLEKQRGIFLQAYKFFQAKNQEGAFLFFTRALEVYPQLEDYSLYYLGLLLQKQGKPREALVYFQRLIDSHPESVWLPEAATEASKIFLAEGNWQEALRYGQLARSSPRTMAEATLLVAHARRTQGESTLAYPLYQEVRKRMPASAPGEEAKAWVYDLRSTHPDLFGLTTEEDFLQEGQLLLDEKDRTGVEEVVARYTEKFPAGRLHPEMLNVRAYAYRKEGKMARALALLEELAVRYPKSSAAPEALHTWATILWNRDEDREALRLFQRLVQRYPHHALAADSLYAIGRIYEKAGKDALAAEAYTKLTARFPQSPLAREGKWRQGWMAYRWSDFRRAQTLFSQLVGPASGTVEGEGALYWQGRSAERAGQRDKAVQLYQMLLQQYPDGYYALWAEKRLNAPLIPPSYGRSIERPFGTGLALGNTDPMPPVSLTTFMPEAYPHFLRSQELKALGLFSLARRELDAFTQEMPRESSLLHFLLKEYSSVEGYTAALRLAQALSRGQSDGEVWQEYLYPRAYWGAVKTRTAQKGLDPYLVLALMRQESLFDPEAVSPAGALGLTQLLPATAARFMQAPPASLTDPDLNVDLGTTYLHRLLDLYNGNLILALAAYNAGEEAVDRWQRRYPGLEPDEFVESLSFRETRNYVKLVLRNYRTYLRLYEKSWSVPLKWPVAARR